MLSQTILTDRQRQAGRQTNWQADRQIDRHRETHSFIESFEVDSVLGLGEFLAIILTLNFEFLTHSLCRQVTVAGNVNDCYLLIHRSRHRDR